MGVVAERTGWDEEKTTEISEEMTEIFGTLYGALQ
jgi:translation initiation factor 2 alpha subunit (eIF-2alpha)